MTIQEMDVEVKRLLALQDDEMITELKKKPQPQLAELGHHSPELVRRIAESSQFKKATK